MVFKNNPENKRYYWLKLKNDFFDQKEIKMLRKIAGGDTYTIIYLKMLLKSLQDNGSLYFEAIGEDFTEELALDLDEEVENVAMTLQFLQTKGLLEIVEGDEYFLNRVPEMVGSESYSAERMRNLRKREKDKTLQSDMQLSHCDSSVTKRIEQEKEQRKDFREERGESTKQKAKQEQDLDLDIDLELYGESAKSELLQSNDTVTLRKVSNEVSDIGLEFLDYPTRLNDWTVENCIDEYIECLGKPCGTEKKSIERLYKEHPTELLVCAIDTTSGRIENGNKIDIPIAYITKLLNDWKAKGYTAIRETQEEQEEFNEEVYGDGLPF